LKLRHVFRIARGASDVRHNLLVELEDGGRTGLGEAAPIKRYGEDRDTAAQAVDAMARRLGDPRAFALAAGEAAVPGQASAEAAVDMALHDLAGQRLGAPLYEVLGIDPRRAPETSFTIGMDTPEVVAAKVKEASAYSILKVKMGSDDDRAMLQAVRDTTKQRLRVDANEGWTPADALERLHAFVPGGPWLQPLTILTPRFFKITAELDLL
jgi:L-alanine-DL-glutamate epimerase-like enolase superfamily enzyme